MTAMGVIWNQPFTTRLIVPGPVRKRTRTTSTEVVLLSIHTLDRALGVEAMLKIIRDLFGVVEGVSPDGVAMNGAAVVLLELDGRPLMSNIKVYLSRYMLTISLILITADLNEQHWTQTDIFEQSQERWKVA